MKEIFRNITYSDEALFIHKNDKVSLKEYVDNIVAYASFDQTFDLDYFDGTKTASGGNNSLLENLDAAPSSLGGKHLLLSDSIIFNKNNFVNLKRPTIKFYLRPWYANDYGKQYFVNSDILIQQDSAGEYTLSISVAEDFLGNFVVSLSEGDTQNVVWGKISAALTSISSRITLALDEATNTLYFRSVSLGEGVSVAIFSSNASNSSILDLEESVIYNSPDQEIVLASFTNQSDDLRKFEFIHTPDGWIKINLYNSNGFLAFSEDVIRWSNHHNIWDFFEIHIEDENLILFLNGRLRRFFILDNYSCDFSNLYLKIEATNDFQYRFDNLLVLSEVDNIRSYDLPLLPMTRYTTSRPYVEIDFGSGFSNDAIRGITLLASENTRYIIQQDSEFFFYFGNGWIESDGSFAQSSAPEYLESYINDFIFIEDSQVKFRIYFDSNGNINSWLDAIEFDYIRDEDTTAKVRGARIVDPTTDLSLDKEITISTNSGTYVIDLTSEALDESAVTREEIIDAIDAAEIDDLKLARYDGYFRIFLETESSGEDAFISVSAGVNSNALPLVWGFAVEDRGEVKEIIERPMDFSPIYHYIRTQLGHPITPVELTDEQLLNCVGDALYEFKKWRNFKEEMIYTTLVGTPRDGYEIPAVVGGEENIVDVVVKPRFHLGHYAFQDDLMDNIYVQRFFHQKNIMANAADLHISLMAQKDLRIMLNQDIKIEYMNRRIFIHPEPYNLKVAIKFKSPLSINEINNEVFVKRLSLAYSKIVLGTIRSTFGNEMPGGEGMIRLNGDALLQDGKAEVMAIIEEMRKSTAVYDWLFE